MAKRTVRMEGRIIGRGGRPFFITGPCVIESRKHCLKLAEKLADIANRFDIDLIFKASYDKANRSSSKSFRGPGLEEGLRVLEEVKNTSGLPVLSDVQETTEIAAAGVDGFFFEVHDHPERALSDGPNALHIRIFPRLLDELLAIRSVLRKSR